jgi:hypothetical protein
MLPLSGPDDSAFDQGCTSYTALALAPLHPNERPNLETKLSQAFHNLRTKAPPRLSEERDGLFVRIPAHLPLGAIATRVREYVGRGDPPYAVIVYQPSIRVDLGTDTSAFTHACVPVPSASVNDWLLSEGNRLNPVFALGEIQTVGFEYRLVIGDRQVAVADHYVFQNGHHYVRGRTVGNETTGSMHYLAGIHTHSVMEVNGKVTILSGKFPPSIDPVLV